MAAEKDQATKEWANIAIDINEELVRQISVIQRDIRSKEQDHRIQTNFVSARYKGEYETKEKEWREMTMKWLTISKSKVASKVEP
jgi:hypothetical protein